LYHNIVFEKAAGDLKTVERGFEGEWAKHFRCTERGKAASQSTRVCKSHQSFVSSDLAKMAGKEQGKKEIFTYEAPWVSARVHPPSPFAISHPLPPAAHAACLQTQRCICPANTTSRPL